MTADPEPRTVRVVVQWLLVLPALVMRGGSSEDVRGKDSIIHRGSCCQTEKVGEFSKLQQGSE